MRGYIIYVTHLLSYTDYMSDVRGEDRFSCLYMVAASQMGHVTARQARTCGMASNLIAYHVSTGRLMRVHRGVYRLRDYPSSPREEVMAAWLAAGPHRAVISHESALDILGLGDLIPDRVHLMVPRSVRNLPRLHGIRFHTSSKPPQPKDVLTREGMRVTAPSRTVLDLAQAGIAPDHLESVVREGIAKGILLPDALVRDAGARSQRVLDVVRQAVQQGV